MKPIVMSLYLNYLLIDSKIPYIILDCGQCISRKLLEILSAELKQTKATMLIVTAITRASVPVSRIQFYHFGTL